MSAPAGPSNTRKRRAAPSFASSDAPPPYQTHRDAGNDGKQIRGPSASGSLTAPTAAPQPRAAPQDAPSEPQPAPVNQTNPEVRPTPEAATIVSRPALPSSVVETWAKLGKRFYCPQCVSPFEGLQSAYYHLSGGEPHGIKATVCTDCGERVPKIKAFARHTEETSHMRVLVESGLTTSGSLMEKIGVTVYPSPDCRHCNIGFPDDQQLVQLKEHTFREHHCEWCRSTFKSRRQRYQHLDEKHAKCPKCRRHVATRRPWQGTARLLKPSSPVVWTSQNTTSIDTDNAGSPSSGWRSSSSTEPFTATTETIVAKIATSAGMSTRFGNMYCRQTICRSLDQLIWSTRTLASVLPGEAGRET
jgi:hypothetical protein